MAIIVVGLDDSERAQAVLAEAAALARPEDELLVVRAIGAEVPPEALSLSPEKYLLELGDLHRAQLDALVRPLAGRVRLRVEARHGPAWEVLCDAAKEQGARLLVVGTRGHRLWERALGTTAAAVVNHAPCSVLAVRFGDAPPAASGR